MPPIVCPPAENCYTHPSRRRRLPLFANQRARCNRPRLLPIVGEEFECQPTQPRVRRLTDSYPLPRLCHLNNANITRFADQKTTEKRLT